jgi:hypothetical protein
VSVSQAPVVVVDPMVVVGCHCRFRTCGASGGSGVIVVVVEPAALWWLMLMLMLFIVDMLTIDGVVTWKGNFHLSCDDVKSQGVISQFWIAATRHSRQTGTGITRVQILEPIPIPIPNCSLMLQFSYFL